MRVVRLQIRGVVRDTEMTEERELHLSQRSMLLAVFFANLDQLGSNFSFDFIVRFKWKFFEAETERNGRSNAPGLVEARCINRQESRNL